MEATTELAASPLERSDDEGGRLGAVAVAVGGPLLIVACSLFALRGFAFHPLLTNRHPDILGFWLPRFAFLGRSLRAGHVPLWNPYEMAGYRFAADPQSGWLAAAPMALFTWLSPGAAMRGLIVFHPIAAGLGLWWFLRKEGLSRAAATAGGLSLAMLMATSQMAISMPFAGFLAWTTFLLVGASGYRQDPPPSRRLAWLGLGAFAWSQVATAHMSHGLVMATLLVTVYLVVWARRERTWWLAVGFLAFLPLASLAILIPRFGFIRDSSLHAGYDALDAGTDAVGAQAILTHGVWSGWPLTYGLTPGPYLGAVMLLTIPLAARARRWRPLMWVFGISFAISYLLTLDVLVTAGWFRAIVLKLPFGDVYLHYPGRLWYLSMIALPVLGAIGIQGLLDAPPRGSFAWLVPGVALFLLVPLALGGHLIRFMLFAIAIVPAAFALRALRSGRRHAPAIVVGVLAAELIASAAYAGNYTGGTIFSGLESGGGPDRILIPQPLRSPDLPTAAFLQPSPIARTLAATQDRYLTWDPPAAFFQKGYLTTQRPTDWPALVMERGTLFGAHDVLGYNPVQLPRYWTYIRSANPLSVFYNASVLSDPTPRDLHLFGVRYLVMPSFVHAPNGVPGHVVATGDHFSLFELDGWTPRASLVGEFAVAPDAAAAQRAVFADGFDPATRAVVEGDPGITSSAGASPGSAAYREASPENVTVTVDATAASILVVRNVYDPGWSATVDGRPAPVLPTDFVMQGVAVPTGHHVVALTYRDPDVWRGLWASALVWTILALAIAAAVVRERLKRSPDGG